MRARLHGSSIFTFVLVLGLTMAGVPAATAQAGPSPQPASSATAAAPTSGVRAEFLNELKGEEDEFVQIAEAIPADKYTWRPAEGVRSVSEVFMHVAAANFNLTKVFGYPPPAELQGTGIRKVRDRQDQGNCHPERLVRPHEAGCIEHGRRQRRQTGGLQGCKEYVSGCFTVHHSSRC